MNAIPLDETRCHLGEGPVWDSDDQALYWVDSLGPTLYRHDWESRTTKRWDLPGDSVGSLAVRQTGGLILAMDQGFYAFDPETGNTELIAEPLAGQEHSHFNDGKVDRSGRFVAGGVNGAAGTGQEPQPVCGMFRLDTDLSVSQVLGEFACFNGPCFSADGSQFFVTGRGDMDYIEAFDYDGDAGTATNGRIIATDLDPDGATVDSEGCLWSAQWAGGCVLRLTPDGETVHRIAFPGHVVSSVMFGGPALDTIFVTTLGRPHWGTTPEAPDAGAVFMIERSGFTGLAEPRFMG